MVDDNNVFVELKDGIIKQFRGMDFHPYYAAIYTTALFEPSISKPFKKTRTAQVK